MILDSVEGMGCRTLCQPVSVVGEARLCAGQPDLAVVADLNGNGHKDLLVAAHNGRTLYVLLGDGKGQFKSKCFAWRLWP